jgi:8-oxo-dGTP diphosphatase
LAFDHEELLERALSHLRRRLGEAPILFELLPGEFTLSELQVLAETILGRELDRRNFRRKVLEAEIVAPTGGERREGAHRPAALFRFAPEAFARHAEQERWLPF